MLFHASCPEMRPSSNKPPQSRPKKTKTQINPVKKAVGQQNLQKYQVHPKFQLVLRLFKFKIFTSFDHKTINEPMFEKEL